MRITELVDTCRKRGLTVVEMAGWQTRGYDFPTRPDGALRHWTAGGSSDTSSLSVVTNGRGGANPLPGPLCNIYQSRRVDVNGFDIVYAIASGKANHAGAGTWNGISGNYKLLGLEIEWSGPNEAFANVRKRKLTSELVMRALLDCCTGTSDNDVGEHREYAPTRKIDTNLDGNEMRRRMTELRSGTTPIPTPTPAYTYSGDDDEMHKPAMIVKGKDKSEWWLTDTYTKQHIKSQGHAAIMRYIKTASWDDTTGGPFVWPQADVDSIRTVV